VRRDVAAGLDDDLGVPRERDRGDGAAPPPPTEEGADRSAERAEAARAEGLAPHAEQVVTVLEPAGRLTAQRPGPGVTPKFDGSDDGKPYAVWLQPTPLILGAPFSGAVDLTQPLEGGDARVELTVEIQAGGGFGTGTSLALAAVLGSGSSNLSESLTVWRGAVTPSGGEGGWGRLG